MKLIIQENQRSKLFFTADVHAQHKNIIQYCNRPFKDVHHMHKVITENWNSVIPKDGIIVSVGDFCFRDPEQIVKHLNGKIIFVVGSHDKSSLKKPHLFLHICEMLELSIKPDLYITACHYPMRRWPKSHYNAWHIYGHVHTMPRKHLIFGKSYDVGMDSNNFTPLSLNNIIDIMSTRPDNENLVTGKKTRKVE